MNVGMENRCELLTVILPVRNRKERLRGTLRSIAMQREVTAGNVGLIIVDNGSTDGASEIVKKWVKDEAPAWLRVEVLVEEKSGACAARNRGLAAASGEWVMFFDSDDVMGGDHLWSVANAIKGMEANADLIYWDVAFLKCDGRRGVHRGRAGEDVWMNVIMRGVLSTQRYCCRRDFVVGAGCWDEEVEVWNDWELSVRLMGSGARVVYRRGLPTVTVIEHDDSITGKFFSDKAGKREVALEKGRRFGIAHGLGGVVRLIDMKGAVLAGDYAREGRGDLSKDLLGKLIAYGTVAAWKLHVIAWMERMLGKGASVVVRVSARLF